MHIGFDSLTIDGALHKRRPLLLLRFRVGSM